jgi:F-type H+-transporting ATPase subunit gamma
MAKARAIVKRRKAVRNIKKITKTMQMIATAKFQKSLKRAVGTKPYTLKVRELVRDLALSVRDTKHPLLRHPTAETRKGIVALVVITSNRGLAGAFNGTVLRAANAFIREQEQAGNTIEIYAIGKKGINFFNYQKRPMRVKSEANDVPSYAVVDKALQPLLDRFISGEIDGVHVAYMNFISTGVQKPEVLKLLPLPSVEEVAERIAHQAAEKEAQAKAGALDAKRSGADIRAAEHQAVSGDVIYDFSPSAQELMNELLPLMIKTAFFQTFLDATTSEHVSRMVAMKSATDNADKMSKALTMQYNRARQSQITTELSEIMGGVEAMKG